MKTDGQHDAFPCVGGQQGLTKREYFAAMAMNGLVSTDLYGIEDCAERAVKQSDALIKQLNKQQEKN